MNADNSTLVIMADYDNSLYAWLRPETQPCGCGVRLADASSGFPKSFGVSTALEDEFKSWITRFHKGSHKPDFPWKTWHREGITLAKKLKKETKHDYPVEYHYTLDDPTRAPRKTVAYI